MPYILNAANNPVPVALGSPEMLAATNVYATEAEAKLAQREKCQHQTMLGNSSTGKVCCADCGTPQDAMSPACSAEAILLEAVAVTRQSDDGMHLEWLIEGGISAMEAPGIVLMAAPAAPELCAEDGSAWVQLCSDSDDDLRKEVELLRAVIARQPSFIHALEKFSAEDGTFVRLDDVLGALTASAQKEQQS